MTGAAILLTLLAAYAALGVLVAAAFVLGGVDRIDPAAHHSWAFRVLLLPGLVLLWPLVLKRWRERAGGIEP